MHSLELKNITKSYDKQNLVLDNLSLSVAAGDFIVIVGPSGCGKSTLLKIISGLEDVNDGEIVIGEKVMNDVDAKDRKVSMVFQNYALYPHMTIFDNLSFSLKLKKVRKTQIKDEVLSVAKLLDIQDILERKPKSISGGQKQRVALGRAIINNPDIMLLDEPLSNLDAQLRISLRSELKKLHSELKTTMLYVTHDQIEAMTLGNKVAVIDKGILQQFDRPMELYMNPKNMFVAGFIGSPPMNFIKMNDSLIGMLREKDSKINPDILNRENSEISIGIRPESLSLANSDSAIKFDATLELIEPIGSEVNYHLRYLGKLITMTSKINSFDPINDESVSVFAEPSDLYYFDNVSGEIIEKS